MEIEVFEFARKYGKELWQSAHYLLNSADFYGARVEFDAAREALASKMLANGLNLPVDALTAQAVVRDAALELAQISELRATAKARIAWRLVRLELSVLGLFLLNKEAALALGLPDGIEQRVFLGANIPEFFSDLLLTTATKDSLVNTEITNRIIKSLHNNMFRPLNR